MSYAWRQQGVLGPLSPLQTGGNTHVTSVAWGHRAPGGHSVVVGPAVQGMLRFAPTSVGFLGSGWLLPRDSCARGTRWQPEQQVLKHGQGGHCHDRGSIVVVFL